MKIDMMDLLLPGMRVRTVVPTTLATEKIFAMQKFRRLHAGAYTIRILKRETSV